MVLTSVKSGIVERLGLGNEAGYHQIETLGDAFGALKSGGSRLKQRMIAGSIISGLLIMLFVAFSPDTTTASLRQESLDKWWKTGHDGSDAAIEETTWSTIQDTKETCNAIPETVQVAIWEHVRAHDEVDAALVHSLASQPNVNLTLYQQSPRFGSEKIFQAFGLDYTGPLNPDDFMSTREKTTIPDLLILTTCEIALRAAPNRLATLLAQGQTKLICVAHHADHWAEEERKSDIRPWIDAGMIEFWTLSPHTATFLDKTIAAWDNPPSPQIRVFVPIFPVKVSASTAVEAAEGLSFAMQGDYDPHRRDYAHIFQRLGSFLAATDTNISMHLLGQGTRPPVPENVVAHVFFDQGLSYTDFYALLSSVSAVLPGFASDEYLDRKASSSVPAALIAGTPLVADRRILDAYSYVEEDSVWLQGDDESEFDVVGRMLGASDEERKAKSEHAKANAEKIIQENVKRVGEWVAEAVSAMYCRGSEGEEE